jgi:hypothetical protein
MELANKSFVYIFPLSTPQLAAPQKNPSLIFYQAEWIELRPKGLVAKSRKGAGRIPRNSESF